MKKLVIIDGKSVFYRGYYAMGALSLKDGTPTSGVYGFAVIALKLVQDLRPDKVVVAWDKAKTSVSKRTAIYADYKAGRHKPPEDFFAQIPLLRQLILDLHWEFVECDGYEADDIIGTLARQADEAGDWETTIISSDLDMLQVVDENTRMYRLLKGFSELEEIDVPAVEAKYGISKPQFLDLKALKGDASDNIPGVPGIGEKTAVKLLNDYGTLDGIYEHVSEISGAVGKKLVAGKESAYMSRQLAEIMTDAPVELGEMREFKIGAEEMKGALTKLEFHSLVRKFLKDNPSNHFSSDTLKAARPSLRSEEKDLQGLSSDTHVAINETYEPSEKESLQESSLNTQEVTDKAQEITDEIPGLVLGDAKRRMHESAEVAERILGGEEFYDLSQGKFLLDPLDRQVDEGPKQLGLNFGETPEEIAANRAECARQLAEFKQLPKLYKVFTELDLPMVPVLYKMEKKGIKISREYFAALLAEFQRNVAAQEQKIYTEAGETFNINSPIQLSEILYDKLGLPTKGIKKTSRGYSTGAKELEKLKNEHAIIPMIMEYREMAKLLSTYIAPLPTLADGNDRIHTTFTQNVTSTGRLSSVGPNLQNIPVRTEDGKRIRTGFVAEEGKSFVSADYSQFELRLAAVLAGDEALVSDFNSGVDIHTKTAADVFGVPMEEVTKTQRRAAKVINFGVLYGMSAKGLADAAGMNVGEAKQFIDGYFQVRRPIREYLDKILTQAREEGFVETYYGRRRPTPDVKSSNFIIRMGAERAAQNMPIQGTEADLMKRAMIHVDKVLPEGADLVLQVHDSLIVECDDALVPEVKEILQIEMENVAPELAIKLAVEVTTGKNWGNL